MKGGVVNSRNVSLLNVDVVVKSSYTLLRRMRYNIDIQYTSSEESSIIPILFSTSQKYGKYCEPDSEQEVVSQRVERCCIEAVSWSCAVNKARSQGVPQSLIRSAALSRAGHRYTLSLSEDIIRIIRCCCFLSN